MAGLETLVWLLWAFYYGLPTLIVYSAVAFALYNANVFRLSGQYLVAVAIALFSLSPFIWVGGSAVRELRARGEMTGVPPPSPLKDHPETLLLTGYAALAFGPSPQHWLKNVPMQKAVEVMVSAGLDRLIVAPARSLATSGSPTTPRFYRVYTWKDRVACKDEVASFQASNAEKSSRYEELVAAYRQRLLGCVEVASIWEADLKYTDTPYLLLLSNRDVTIGPILTSRFGNDAESGRIQRLELRLRSPGQDKLVDYWRDQLVFFPTLPPVFGWSHVLWSKTTDKSVKPESMSVQKFLTRTIGPM